MMCSIDSQKTIQNCRFAFYKLSVDSKSTCSFWNHLVVRHFSNPRFVWCFKATFQWLKTSSLRTCRVGRMMSLGVSLWKRRPVIFGRSPFVRRNGLHQRSAFLCAEKHGGAIHFQRSNTKGTQMMQKKRFFRDVNRKWIFVELSRAGKHKLYFPASLPGRDFFCTRKITLQVAENDLKCSKMKLPIWIHLDNPRGTKHRKYKKIFTSARDSRSLFAQVLQVQLPHTATLRLILRPMNLSCPKGMPAPSAGTRRWVRLTRWVETGVWWHLKGIPKLFCHHVQHAKLFFSRNNFTSYCRANGFTHIS